MRTLLTSALMVLAGPVSATDIYCKISKVCNSALKPECSFGIVDSGFSLEFNEQKVLWVDGPCTPIGGGRLGDMIVNEEFNTVTQYQIRLHCTLDNITNFYYSIDRISGQFERNVFHPNGGYHMETGTCRAVKQKF
ncbi:hypothetical protein N9C04_00990 [Planktomarina temperata]|nr:hypothetical protein [Planktomarina temperata]|tara:strand:- start:240 stop:647 length:408 start_codon:yes stop_codon:yes gene_type:complete